MTKKKWINFISITLIVASFIIGVQSLHKQQIFQAIEANSYDPCVPRIDGKRIIKKKHIGEINRNNKRYHIFSVLENKTVPNIDDLIYQQETITIVSVDSIGCYVELGINDYGKFTLEKYFPQKLAREIALLILKDKVNEAGGVAAYMQKRIDDSFGEDYGQPEIFFPEVLWAWEILGLKVPGNYRVIEDINEIEDGTYSPMYE